MNTAVNMNQVNFMNGGYDMNQTNYMNGGSNMNQTNYMNGGNNMNNTIINGGYAMNTMNNNFTGLNVNQELIAYLESGVQTFKNYEEYMEGYEVEKACYEDMQQKPEKVAKKWRWITIGGPIAVALFLGSSTIMKILLTAGTIAATQFAKQKLMAADQEKAVVKAQESQVEFAQVEAQKAQLDSHIETYFGYVPEQYRNSNIMSYMLDMAKTGRAWDMNQAYALADNEIHRMNLEAAQMEMLKKQQEDAEGDRALGIMGSIAMVGLGSLVGSCLGHSMRN